MAGELSGVKPKIVVNNPLAIWGRPEFVGRRLLDGETAVVKAGGLVNRLGAPLAVPRPPTRLAAVVTSVARGFNVAGCVAEANGFETKVVPSVARRFNVAGCVAEANGFGTKVVPSVARRFNVAGCVAEANGFGTMVVTSVAIGFNVAGCVAEANGFGTEVVGLSIDLKPPTRLCRIPVEEVEGIRLTVVCGKGVTTVCPTVLGPPLTLLSPFKTFNTTPEGVDEDDAAGEICGTAELKPLSPVKKPFDEGIDEIVVDCASR